MFLEDLEDDLFWRSLKTFLGDLEDDLFLGTLKMFVATEGLPAIICFPAAPALTRVNRDQITVLLHTLL